MFNRFRTIYICVAILIAATASFFYQGFSATPLEAQTSGGAAVVTVNTPSVSGTGVTVSGVVEAGLSKCGTRECTSSTHQICNCCNIPPIECNDIPWETCDISSVTYNISGPTSRSGSVTVTGTTNTPSGCTTGCSINGDQCDQTQNYSLSETGLTAGTYTVTVTSQDCKGTNSSQRQFTINDPNTVPKLECTPGTQNAAIGSTVSFSPKGGTGTYSWSAPGGNPSSGSRVAFSTSYTTLVTKTVTLTRGTQKSNCSETVISADPKETQGTHVNNNACTVNGWAYDENNMNPLTPVQVRIYSDGTFVKSVTADLASGSGVTCPQGNCRFSASLAGLITPGVAHSIEARAVDLQTGAMKTLTNSPQPMTCSAVCGDSDGICPSGCTNPPDIDCPMVVPDTDPTCTPETQGTSQGMPITLYATGGNNSYSWSAPEGATKTGTNSSFTTSFNTTGTKTITLTSGSKSKQCTVIVNEPNANYPTANLRIDLLKVKNFLVGQSGNLTWSTNYTTTCFGSAVPTSSVFNGPVPAQRPSSQPLPTGALTRSTIYSLRCENGWGEAQSTAKAVVLPECSPAGTTVGVGQSVTLTAAGGNGMYSWSAAGGNPSSGNQTSLTTSYAATGTKSVILSSEGSTDTCSVTVTDSTTPASKGIVRVISNVPTTWTLSGPVGGNRTQSTPSTSVTYSDMPVGNYTVTPGSVSGYDVPQTLPAPSQNLFNNQTVTFSLDYPSIDDEGTIDIKANGSDTPAAIPSGATVLLSWISENIVDGSCVAGGGWSGSKADAGSQNSTSLSANTTFRITCESDSGEDVEDFVTVTVRPPQCSDSADNDSDAKSDYPSDPGCVSVSDDDESNSFPQCSDGIDNADPEDTIADASDPGCWTNATDPTTYNASDPDETDSAIEDIVDCSDGFDNDGDGNVDYPDDDGCSDETDSGEQKEPDIREI